MKQSKISRYAYAAGLIDGEGCIRIEKRKARNNRSDNYFLSICLYQKDGRMVDWLFGNFGGKVYSVIMPPGKINENGGTIYQWRILNRKALEFLKKILPFLTVKKSQAEIGIRFGWKLKDRTGRRNGMGRVEKLTDNELKEKEELKQMLHIIKKQYKESAVVETKRDEPSFMKVSNSPR